VDTAVPADPMIMATEPFCPPGRYRHNPRERGRSRAPARSLHDRHM